jgi:hypothetical protein
MTHYADRTVRIVDGVLGLADAAGDVSGDH